MKNLNENVLNDDQLNQVSGGRRRPRSPYTNNGRIWIENADTSSADKNFDTNFMGIWIEV